MAKNGQRPPDKELINIKIVLILAYLVGF